MPDNDRQDDQHGKLKPSDQTHARPVHDLLWAVLIIIAALASIQIDPQHGAENAGLIFVIGMSLLFIKCLRDAIQIAGQGRAAQRPETLHTWPPTLPNQWPPIPPVTLTLPSAPSMTILLQLVSPMLLAMLLLTFMRSYGQISTANFIPNDVASIHAQWIYLATGIGVIAILWIWVYRSIPWLFHHDAYLKASADPFIRTRFALAMPILVVAWVMNLSSFPKAVLQQLHEHSSYAVFQQQLQITAKSYRDQDDVFALTLRAANGQTFVLQTNDAIYDQTVIGSTVAIAGSETPYGRLIVDVSVIPTTTTHH